MIAQLRRVLVALALVFCATAAPAFAEERMISAEDARADLRFLYESLQQAQYDLYAHTPRRVLERAYRRQMRAFDMPVSLLDFQVELQRFTALVRVAHTRLEFPSAAYNAYLQAGGRSFPLEIRIDEGHIFVLANRSGVEGIAPGDEILALNGRSASYWLGRLSRNVSADTAYLAHSIVEYRPGGLLWLELGPVGSFELEVRKPGGRRVALRVPALPKAEQDRLAALQPRPFTLGDERTARMIEGGIAYLRPGPFYNVEAGANMWDNASFRTFIDGAFGRFNQAGARALLIDLRNNPGGDAAFSDLMLSWIATRPYRFVSDFRIRVSPQTTASNRARMEQAAQAGIPDTVSPRFAALFEGAADGSIVSFPVAPVEPRSGGRFEGRVYVLIDRYSYSNTVNVAAIVQDYGFGTVLGEPTTDMATTYGAMEHFTLPRSGLQVGYAKAFLIRPNGDRRAAGVTPDILIHTPVVQTGDPVLERALSIVRSGARRPARAAG